MEDFDLIAQARRDLKARREALLEGYGRMTDHADFLRQQGRIKEIDVFARGLDDIIERRQKAESLEDEGSRHV